MRMVFFPPCMRTYICLLHVHRNGTDMPLRVMAWAVRAAESLIWFYRRRTF